MKNYSAKELSDFRFLLICKLESALKQYEEIRRRLNAYSYEKDLKNKSESSKNSEERERLSYSANRLKKYLNSLTSSLLRIENGTYGIPGIYNYSE
ncbi:MAG: hypothetical protein ABI772_02855 [Bacteroidota bacterium]